MASKRPPERHLPSCPSNHGTASTPLCPFSPLLRPHARPSAALPSPPTTPQKSKNLPPKGLKPPPGCVNQATDFVEAVTQQSLQLTGALASSVMRTVGLPVEAPKTKRSTDEVGPSHRLRIPSQSSLPLVNHRAGRKTEPSTPIPPPPQVHTSMKEATVDPKWQEVISYTDVPPDASGVEIELWDFVRPPPGHTTDTPWDTLRAFPRPLRRLGARPRPRQDRNDDDDYLGSVVVPLPTSRRGDGPSGVSFGWCACLLSQAPAPAQKRVQALTLLRCAAAAAAGTRCSGPRTCGPSCRSSSARPGATRRSASPRRWERRASHSPAPGPLCHRGAFAEGVFAPRFRFVPLIEYPPRRRLLRLCRGTDPRAAVVGPRGTAGVGAPGAAAVAPPPRRHPPGPGLPVPARLREPALQRESGAAAASRRVSSVTGRPSEERGSRL